MPTEDRVSPRGFFEELVPGGDVYKHPLGRAITSAGNIWFTLLTRNTAPVHFKAAYAGIQPSADRS